MNNTDLQTISALLRKAEKVAVFCHVRPDGDALGSGLAVCRALNEAGKTAEMFCEDPAPDRLKIVPDMEKVNTCAVDCDKYDTFIAVDCADIARLGAYSNAFRKFKGATLNFDHHVSNSRYAKYNYVAECTATCELLPEIFSAAGFTVTREIADLLTIGLLTDSGNFAHKDVTGKTFRVAAFLKDSGADVSGINGAMFSCQSKSRALLFARVINKMRFALDDRLAMITVTRKDMAETGSDKSLTEGFVDFPLSIDGVEVAVALMEVDDCQYKASLRSKNTNVNEIAAKFGGGGHVLASGCMLFGEYEEVVDKLTYAVYQGL